VTSTPPGDRHLTWHPGHLSRSERWASLGTGVAGATVWLTGLSGSGKSTIAALVEARLLAAGRPAYLLDGDNLRHGLTADLGFTDADRSANVARVAEVARLFADAGVVALVSLISPFRAGRDHARQLHADAGLPFFEVWVSAPLDICEGRDPKGLYARARAGKVPGFTGIDSPYEEPLAPDLVLATDVLGVDDAAGAVLALLGSDGA
jgi:bifunctional enzyme CysN/CysC